MEYACICVAYILAIRVVGELKMGRIVKLLQVIMSLNFVSL